MPTHPQSLPLNQLQPNPLQPRGKIIKEQLDELVKSIQLYGVLEPIIVAQTPAGYQIIAGERRWRASKLAGLEEVPVIVKVTTPRGMLEMAIIENVQRVDLSAMERAQAFQQLVRDFHFSQNQVAEKVGKSAGYVSNTIKLLQLPDAIKDGLAGGIISEGHARALVAIDNERSMIECYKTILKENASVRRAEELVRRYKEKLGQTVKMSGGRMVLTSPQIDEWQSALQKVFTPKSQVKLVRSARQTKVVFVFKGSPEETQDELNKIINIAKKH
jgi:ParB family chromosome partitioning protein